MCTGSSRPYFAISLSTASSDFKASGLFTYVATNLSGPSIQIIEKIINVMPIRMTGNNNNLLMI
jgi:hypothetical protein